MIIKTLEHTELKDIVNTFNLSFSDYFVPIQLELHQFEYKVNSEDIDLSISAGAFKNDQLIGFILHGKRELKGIKTFYNAGTGVIPEERGQGLTTTLYHFCLSLLKEQHFKQGVLEVISNNHIAISIYKRMGYDISRTLHCYRGIPKADKIHPQLKIRETDQIDWGTFTKFWDWQPSWQNQTQTIEYLAKELKTLMSFLDDRPVGYITYNPKNYRIHQFAVDKSYRNQNIGYTLFDSLPNEKHISLINIDGNDTATNTFLKQLKLELFLTQYEMLIRV